MSNPIQDLAFATARLAEIKAEKLVPGFVWGHFLSQMEAEKEVVRLSEKVYQEINQKKK